MNTSLITLEKVSFGYRQNKLALNNVDMTIPAGARIALVGPNGAGKSTLFLQCNSILQPQQGRLLYRGEPYCYDKACMNALRQKVGLVFQDPDMQLFAGSVWDDVIFGPMNLGLTKAEAESRSRAALEAVDLTDFRHEPSHFLSFGQKKKVAIAGVLAMQPDILFMDEPTAGLDYCGVASLNCIMANLHHTGTTLVVATHDVDWAWSWADLVYVLADGCIVAGGSPEDIFNRADHASYGYGRPIVAEIYAALTGKGIISPAGQAPRDPDQLVELLP